MCTIPVAFRMAKHSPEDGGMMECIRIAFGYHMDNGWLGPFVAIGSFVLTYIYTFRTLKFMSAGNAHYYRCYLVLKWIARLARPVAATHPNFPRIQITTSNVRSLIACVEVILNFGARYQRRIETYVSSIATCCLLLLALLVVVVINQITMQDEGGDVDRRRFRESCPVWSALYVIALFTAMTYLMIIAGASANAALQDLVTNLTSARWQLRKRGVAAVAANGAQAATCGEGRGIEGVDDEEGVQGEGDSGVWLEGRQRVAREEKELDDLLSMAVEIVDRYHKTNPVSLAGVMCNSESGWTLLTVVGTAGGFILGQMFNAL
mmetsp:Transcript_61157/g.167650  ORF Transcript_61157/g.167650 Transcript_61157/m.167650 type:complete len:321 (-) Transcript_61157:349-1311(-)